MVQIDGNRYLYFTPFRPHSPHLLFLIGNNCAIMGKYHLGWLSNLFLIISVVVLVVGTMLLFYGLFMGQGNS